VASSQSPRRFPIPVRLAAFLSVPALLIGVGTVGYRLFEGWSWFDSFYVAVITLGLALGGISTIAVAATGLLSTIITGELRDYLGTRRMAKRIGALQGHVIVCGYGHVAQYLCADLLAGGADVVVIDRQEAPLVAAREAGAHSVLGDATADVTLSRAGIARARALVAAAGSDGDNVLITMAARLLCPALTIVSRAEDEAAVPKLLRAGATHTVSPDALAGKRMAQAVLSVDALAV
jgi:voltage-gated potassium channel